MDLSLSDEQKELARAARKFLGSASNMERVRAVMATESGFDPEVWSQITGDLGWVALTIPEEDGGFGLTQVDLMPVLEEAGRHLLPAPFFSTVCFGVTPLVLGGDAAQRATYLAPIAEGSLTATLALLDEGGSWNAESVKAVAKKEGGDYVLTGTKTWVLDGHTAGLLIVAARAPESRGREGVSLFLVDANAKGVTRTWLPTLDQTRKLAKVVLDGVRVPASAVLRGEGEGAALLDVVLPRASAALAAEQVGGAEACLELAVDYAKVRKQFGKPIGTFQAIQHMCANMLLRVEAARSASYYANLVAGLGADGLAEAAAIAKSYCSEAFFHCASESIQIHGGIGFTWEHDAHLFLKRARASESFLGDPSMHRELLAREIGL
jgi:alkylation response protein AidB-like acyl-CoA dehydrogenase